MGFLETWDLDDEDEESDRAEKEASDDDQGRTWTLWKCAEPDAASGCGQGARGAEGTQEGQAKVSDVT